jgi:putative ABC transport system permease protein
LQADLGGAPGVVSLARVAGREAFDKATIKALDQERGGKYALFTQLAVPLCLGDYYGQFRCVGTTPEFFNELKHGDNNEDPYTFSAGRNFEHFNDEHGYFEAVVGATVAREMNVKVGDVINPTHGDPDGHTHGQGFTVVGIVDPTGTPNDRAVFVNMEGFYLMDDHAKPLEEGEEEGGTSGEIAAAKPVVSKRPDPLPTEQREITAMLVRTTSPLVTPGLQNNINEGPFAQAVLPIQEIFNLLEFIVGPIKRLLLALTVMICVVSGISILVSIYNSMSERRRDIAVMRALGADRTQVSVVILCESIILSVGGGLLGMLSGHTLNWFASRMVEEQTGVKIGFATFAPGWRISELLGRPGSLSWDPAISPEILLVLGLIALAMVVGLLPAISAYRTDVSKSLAP